MDYEIRLATGEDIPQIMRFIDEYWRKGHILSRDRELFEWQYRGGGSGRINMVIGLRDGALRGILGFVAYGASDGKDVAFALWKAVPGELFLGIKLLMFIAEHVPHREIVCTGVNAKSTGAIYERLGMSVGLMRQWYRLNPSAEYKVAKVANGEVPEARRENGRVTELRTYGQFLERFDFGGSAYRDSVPFKSAEYVEWRYFKHPTYKYRMFGLEAGGKIGAVAAVRTQEHDGSLVARVSDVIGDVSLLPEFTPFFDSYLRETGAEYIDLYEAGLPDACLAEGGWLGVKESGNVIPNYFSPYVADNVDIYYSTSSVSAAPLRRDGDQDRPN